MEQERQGSADITMAQEYYGIKAELAALTERADELREELLLKFPEGATQEGNFVVKISPVKSSPRVDWKAVVIELNGKDAVEDAIAKAKDSESKVSYRLEVTKLNG